MGLAKDLMTHGEAEFKEHGVIYQALHTSKMRRPVYERLGWEAITEMTKVLG